MATTEEPVPQNEKEKELEPVFKGVVRVVWSLVFNVLMCFYLTTTKLNQTTGASLALTMAACHSLVTFAYTVKDCTALVSKFGLLKQPFTCRENTVKSEERATQATH